MDRVLYAELTPSAFQQRLAAAPIAYLPLGTLEWHGPHLPLGADGIQSQGFFEALAQRVGGIVLPALFLGPDCVVERDGAEYYGMDILGFPDGAPRQLPGSAYWVYDTLFARLLTGIMRQLKRAGFRIVVAHGHAPSTQAFLGLRPEWDHLGLQIFVCWREDESDGLGIQTDHAAANETSLVMALRGDLVDMGRLPEDPTESILAVNGDDPRMHASAERGRRAIALQMDRMATLLRDALHNR
ncbi:MAG TPA: creatininase family protein [Candidatus Hydrogenedentes bacterium]|nr:creatininase family protein [Candidatus Hydrogenedentota bacterium]